MRIAWLGCLVWSSLLFANSPEQQFNVNERYTVESVELAGSQVDLSHSLRSELTSLVGSKLNPAQLDDLAARIRRELHVRAVTHRLLRGRQPERVRVVFDVLGRPARFEASVPEVLYRSEGGFTGALQGTATVGWQSMTVGVVSNGDDLPERYSGLRVRYEDKKLATERLHFAFLFETYREQWNSSAQQTLDQPTFTGDTSGLYRTRMNLSPLGTLVLGRPLSLTLGFSFERFQPQLPAARIDSANAMVTTLRYHRRLEGSNANQQEWEAGYSLRAATSSLGSDFAYTRHWGQVRYAYMWGRGEISDDLTAGYIDGRAPLFERFVLGNSSMLRGWDRFEIDPLGGSRVIHNSVEYRYRLLDVFYDSGAIWDQGQVAVFRHSLGVGIRQQNGLTAALAFPVREGHIEPVFMVGMNY